jgi:hypothetical protein
MWLNSEFVMVCDRPVHIKIENKRLHSLTGKAIEYKDGWGLYCIDGQRIEDEGLYWKIVSEEMKFSEIMAIENADVRAIALKYNSSAMLEAGAELVNKSARKNELYLIENKEINKFLDEPQIWMLKMICPTGRVFVEGVDPRIGISRDADFCQAEAFGITRKHYSELSNEA